MEVDSRYLSPGPPRLPRYLPLPPATCFLPLPRYLPLPLAAMADVHDILNEGENITMTDEEFAAQKSKLLA